MRSCNPAGFHRASRSFLPTLCSWALSVAVAGCTGYIGSGSSSGSDSNAGRGANTASDSTAGSKGGSAWPANYDGTPSALRRLSRDELVASMTMLTGAAPLRDDLPADQRTPRGSIMLSGTSFIASELGKLKLVVGDFAAKNASTMLTRSGCTLVQQAQRDCLGAWAAKFAEQAFRRPLQATEVASFQKILALAGSNAADDTAAVEGLLTAVFFAPSFLYRTEIGTAVAGNASQRALDANEIATRLSFMVTLAPPDAELLTAAKAGLLQDGVERAKQLGRLSTSDRGKKTLAVLVLEWLGANERKVSTKSAKYLTGLDPDFENSIRASAESAIQNAVLTDAEPTVAGLLSTESYLNDAPVKEITQSAGSGATFSGDNGVTKRLGLMMHPHVIAAHTKEDGSSPFVLGPFMREAFLCEGIPDPPPGAANMARNDVPPGSTTRQSLEYRTGAPLCQTCHSLFSQLGYAFLPFDPVGRWVAQDPTGKPWDLAGSVTPASGTPLTFQSPSELMTDLANEPQVHGCFGQAALRWAFGRELVTDDQDLVLTLNDVATRTKGNVLAILQAVVSAPGFVSTTAPR